tara:strand:- start:88 stop:1242 length:1155 start_codon:yes stop_codon:yes gene_type:complete
MNDLKALIKQFMPFAKEKMGFDRPPKLFLKQDAENAANPLGKTGFYDPENEAITLYTTNRHPKDIMRSLAHELMHHTQKCNGDFDNTEGMGEQGYAQKDSHLRNMEIEAYQASIVFRDWEDSIKGTIYNEHLQKGVKSSMSTKDWKNGEINTLLTEKWGFSFSLNKLNEADSEKDPADFTGTKKREDEEEKALKSGGALEEDEQIDEKSRKDSPDRVAGRDSARRVRPLEETEDDVFAPNHYCVHHGGVSYNGSVEMAEAVNHNYNKELGRVTHYDMKLADGTILENVAAEDIQVTNASLAEGHGHPPGKKDDGESKGDDSKTHKGEKDYTTKKDDDLKHSGKGRGEKKGDKAYVNEERKLQEQRAAKLAQALVLRLKEMKKNG